MLYMTMICVSMLICCVNVIHGYKMYGNTSLAVVTHDYINTNEILSELHSARMEVTTLSTDRRR